MQDLPFEQHSLPSASAEATPRGVPAQGAPGSPDGTRSGVVIGTGSPPSCG